MLIKIESYNSSLKTNLTFEKLCTDLNVKICTLQTYRNNSLKISSKLESVKNPGETT